MASPAQVFRLFVALPVPEQVKDRIESAQSELRGALPGDAVRWTRRDQFHLTLRFLGNVNVERIDPFARELRAACGPFGGLELTARGVGFFPDARRPKVLWVGVRDARGKLAALQQSVESACTGFTTEPGEKVFSGHVTIGRAKNLGRNEGKILASLAENMADRIFGAWTANHVDVIRSVLSSDGSYYEVIHRIELSAH